MANEIRYGGLGDLRLTEELAAEVQLLLADRNALGMHPALMYLGDCGGAPSLTKKLSQVGWNGYDAMSDVAEGASVTNTALTDSSVTVTVSRRAKSYIHSDHALFTDIQGLLSRPSFARDAAISAQMKLTNLIALLVDDFSTTAGPGTGVNADVETLIEAGILLNIANAPVEQGILAMLHTRQWGDVQLDIATAVAGAIQWMEATQEQIAIRGNGFKGTLFGMDIFTSNQVQTANAGADRAGGVFTRGAVAWADATPQPDGNPKKTIIDKILLAEDYEVGSGETTTVQNYYCGVTEAIDECGVTYISDA